MKRLRSLFSPTLTKLAFWRKTPAAEAASAEPDVRDAPAPEVSEADAPEADASPAAERPGWLARLRQVFRRRRDESDAPEAEPAPAAAEAAAPVRASLAEAAGDAADAPDARPSLLARLLGRLRRRPVDTTADAATDATPASGSHTRDEADEADGEAPPSRMRRMRAVLARKVIWIPAAGVAGLALVGTLGLMLWQSGQQNAALEARLKATEKQLQQARPAPAGKQNAAAPGQPEPGAQPAGAVGAAVAATPPQSGGDCDIGSAEGVSLRLKDCIDAFNQETARAGPATR
ncbi:MAG: hypothetical protein AB1720_11060 [Pseudomonadota bacterium]